MTEAIERLRVLRDRYRADGKLMEAKAIERAIAVLREAK